VCPLNGRYGDAVETLLAVAGGPINGRKVASRFPDNTLEDKDFGERLPGVIVAVARPA